jgi:manganese efflux pump family protein
VVALLLVAVALGLSNFAASIGLGAAGASGGDGPGGTAGPGGAGAARVAVVFGVFEAGMPLVGLALGHGLASTLGHDAHWLGGAVLIAIGGYTVLSRNAPGPPTMDDDASRSGRAAAGGGALVLTGFALSLDNLAAGFALGAYHVTFWLAVLVIGAVSVTMSLIGLKLGARLASATRFSDLLSGAVLIAVGGAMAAGAL